MSTADLPYARTFDEIYLYLNLRPCPCGETEFDELVSSSVLIDGVLAERFGGACGGCGRAREFTFRMPDGPPEISLEVIFGTGDEPSQLLEPAEWLGVSDVYANVAQAVLDALERSGDNPADEELVRIDRLLRFSTAALEEVLKFLPDGATRVPDRAFRSLGGHLVLEAEPERFERDRLVRELVSLRQRLADFENAYAKGTDHDGDVDREGVRHA